MSDLSEFEAQCKPLSESEKLEIVVKQKFEDMEKGATAEFDPEEAETAGLFPEPAYDGRLTSDFPSF